MAIESDSIQPVPRLRQELFRMMALAAEELRRLGASVDLEDLGSQQVLAVPPFPMSCHFPVHRPCPPMVVARSSIQTHIEFLLIPNKVAMLISHHVRTWVGVGRSTSGEGEPRRLILERPLCCSHPAHKLQTSPSSKASF